MTTSDPTQITRDNAAWGRALKAAYVARYPDAKVRTIRAPAPEHLCLSGTAEQLDICLSDGAVHRFNMQDAAGAFDGWLWAVRHWCGVRRFTIDIGDDVALPGRSGIYSAHSGRVVFRVRMLMALLGKEIAVGERLAAFIEGHPWQDDITGWLNVGGSGRQRQFSGLFPLKSEVNRFLKFQAGALLAMTRFIKISGIGFAGFLLAA